MNQSDDRILELLDESGLVLSPAVISINLEYTRQWVSERLVLLLQAGLVEKTEPSYYSISELGERYLEGNISREFLEDRDPT